MEHDMSALHRNAATIQGRLRDLGLQIEPGLAPRAHRASRGVAGHTVGQIVKSWCSPRRQPVIVLCAGDRRVDAERLGLRVANAKEAKAATGFAIGGIPPLGHDHPLDTIIDESLKRFDTVWCAAGTTHAVFPVATSALIAAIPGATMEEM